MQLVGPRRALFSRNRFCLLALALTLPLFAADKKKLSDAAAAVEANLKTPEGKRYDNAIGKEFPDKYAAAIRQCKQSVADPAIPPFDLLLKLDGQGKVTDVLVYPETAMAKCAGNALQSAKFSPPPHSDYWLNIHLTFKK